MRLLAVDTATDICGVAIYREGNVEAQEVLNHGETHTRHVMAAISTVLDRAGVALAAIDAFAVTRGPGSFTGLRIGISTVKGMALATGKPMVGISTLEILAHQAQGQAKLVCPIIDARRSELYWSIYRQGRQGIQPHTRECVGPADDIPRQVDAPCLFIGNGVMLYRQQLEAAIPFQTSWTSQEQGCLQPSVLARLAHQKIDAGMHDDVMTFGPVYLRKSDAEISLEKRQDPPQEGAPP